MPHSAPIFCPNLGLDLLRYNSVHSCYFSPVIPQHSKISFHFFFQLKNKRTISKPNAAESKKLIVVEHKNA